MNNILQHGDRRLAGAPIAASPLSSVPGHEAAWLTVSATLLVWLALIEAIVVAGWATRVPILAIAPLLAAVIAPMAAAGGHSWRARWLAFASIAFRVSAIAGICIACAALGHDLSKDGHEYHQQAIMAMRNGWNPFEQPIYPGPHSLWISHYANGAWVLAASLYALTGSIEIGKGISYMMMTCAALLTYSVILDMCPRSRTLPLVVALLAAFNPIACYQLQTYYIDTQVASLVTIFAMLLYWVIRKPTFAAHSALVATCVLGANTKFPVLPYFIVIALTVGAGLAVSGARAAATRASVSVVSGFVLALVIGFHPYVNNLISKGHPFYPLAGPGAMDILTGHVSTEFLQANRFKKFAMSTFSVSEPRKANSLGESETQFRLKLPFTIKAEELRAFYHFTDVRVGGFGPLMGGAVLLTFVALLAAGLTGLRNEEDPRVLACLLVGLLLSSLAMPELWWARYAPQVWLVFVGTAAYVAILAHAKWVRAIANLTLAVLAANVVVVLLPAMANRTVTELDFRAQTESLVQMASNGPPVLMSIREDSTRERLRKLGIRFAEVPELNCNGITDNIIGTSTRVCIPTSSAGTYLRGSPWVARMLGRPL